MSGRMWPQRIVRGIVLACAVVASACGQVSPSRAPGSTAPTVVDADLAAIIEVSRARAGEIATMVMRANAGNLYNLGLK